MSDTQSLKLAQARLLELCARLLVLELDEEARLALNREGLAQGFEELEPGFIDYIVGEWGVEHFDQASAEYCRLFLMPKGTAPVASAWMGDEPAQVGAQIHDAIMGWMLALDLDLEQGPWGRLPLDHIAVLSGLYSLALQSEDEVTVGLAAQIKERAVRPWLGAWVEAVLAKSQNPLYRGVVKLLREIFETNFVENTTNK